jgi:hypothetical protein
MGYQSKYYIAGDFVERAVAADIDHTWCSALPTSADDHHFEKRLRTLGKRTPWRSKLHGYMSCPKRRRSLLLVRWRTGPARQCYAVPDCIDPATAAWIAEELYEKDWTDVMWNEGKDDDPTGSCHRTRVRVCIDSYIDRVGDETGWLLLQ